MIDNSTEDLFICMFLFSSHLRLENKRTYFYKSVRAQIYSYICTNTDRNINTYGTFLCTQKFKTYLK